MDKLQNVFNYQNHSVRTIQIEGDPWFVAKDVCEVLGIKPSAVTNALLRLPGEMKCLYSLQTIRGVKSVNFINEAGLYKLVMRSDKPSALSFQNWIASEVLPSIRKNGMYLTPKTSQDLLDDPEVFLAKALLIAKETIDRQKRLLEEAAPKIELHDAFMDSSSTHSFTDVAKIIGLPSSVFIAYMAESRMLQKNKKGEWLPTKAYEGLGYFKVKIMPKFVHTRLTHEGFHWITKVAQERNWINKEDKQS